jgi:nitroreductase
MPAENRLDPAQETPAPIHELLARRWSPRTFSARPVEAAKLTRLFQAARWAPSSFNAQPWAFVLATQEDAVGHDRLLRTLAETNRLWAQEAPVLVLAVARLDFAHNGTPNRHALYDLGQAVANLTVEATSLGLHIHQMGGFDPRLARELFAIPAGFEPAAVLALGYPSGAAVPPVSRTRKPLADFVFTGSWGHPALLDLEMKSETRPA